VSSTRTGRRSRPVPLDQDDPRVIAAQQAERRLYDHYGLEPAHHPVSLPRLGLRVRPTEVGSGPPVLVVPGNTGDGFLFAPLLPHLPGRRVIVLNRPGGGLSEGMDHTTIGFRDLACYTLSTWTAWASTGSLSSPTPWAATGASGSHWTGRIRP
jgi:pimeloyl-ACP methyl ester carboxylesterase